MKTTVNFDAARELELYTENTREIYEQNTMPTIENLKKKYKRGTYDREKAVVAWGYVADSAAKMYSREFSSGRDWYNIFNASTRRAVAETLESVYFEEYIKEAE